MADARLSEFELRCVRRFAGLIALTLLLGVALGLALSQRYTAYSVGSYVLYRLDHLTGHLSFCRPHAGVVKCEDVRAD